MGETPKGEESEVPEYLCDPITLEVMVNPVLTPSGHTFERSSIVRHIEKFGNNPFTQEKLEMRDLVPNRALAEAIEKYSAEALEKHSKGEEDN